MESMQKDNITVNYKGVTILEGKTYQCQKCQEWHFDGVLTYNGLTLPIFALWESITEVLGMHGNIDFTVRRWNKHE